MYTRLNFIVIYFYNRQVITSSKYSVSTLISSIKYCTIFFRRFHTASCSGVLFHYNKIIYTFTNKCSYLYIIFIYNVVASYTFIDTQLTLLTATVDAPDFISISVISL